MVQVLSVNLRNGKLTLIHLHSVSSSDGGEPVQVLLYYNDGGDRTVGECGIL